MHSVMVKVQPGSSRLLLSTVRQRKKDGRTPGSQTIECLRTGGRQER